MLSGMSAPVLTEISSILYTEYITSTLEIVEKLDLTTLRQEELETVSIRSFVEASICGVGGTVAYPA